MLYVMNATTFGLSQYQDVSIVDLAVQDNTLYAAGASAFYCQDAEQDEGGLVSGWIKTGRLQLGDISAQKEVDRLWVTQQSPDDVMVFLSRDDWQGEEVLGPWLAASLGPATPYNRVVRGELGKGGQYWQVQVQNVSGGQFELRSIVLGVEQTRVMMGA
jgi:hypothetical protein